MKTVTVVQQLENWFGKRQAKLPQNLRLFVAKVLPDWDALSEKERRQEAERMDRQYATKMRIKHDQYSRKAKAAADPMVEAKLVVAWYDSTLDAANWLALKDIAAQDAAMLLCEINPHITDLADGGSEASGTFPADLQDMLGIFQVRAQDGKPRTLSQWATIAKSVLPKSTTWLDSYKAAMKVKGRAKDTDDDIASGRPQWVSVAREYAGEILERHKAEDLHPSQDDVCKKLEDMLREEKVYGHQEKPLSAATIKREAIQGKWWKKNTS